VIDMRRRWHRAGVLVMLALLLAPLAFAGHAHRDAASARACATCVATHHSPTLATPARAHPAGFRVVVAPSRRPSPIPSRIEWSPRAGRAPPSRIPATVA
jgi:hypothetical protein